MTLCTTASAHRRRRPLVTIGTRLVVVVNGPVRAGVFMT